MSASYVKDRQALSHCAFAWLYSTRHAAPSPRTYAEPSRPDVISAGEVELACHRHDEIATTAHS